MTKSNPRPAKDISELRMTRAEWEKMISPEFLKKTIRKLVNEVKFKTAPKRQD